MRRTTRFLPAAAFLCAALSISSCSEKTTAPKDSRRDQPPQTEITFAPMDSDTVAYRVHIYWYGFDKDGEVVRFRFAMDGDTAAPENQWHTTTAKDTTLKLLVDPVTAVLRHVVEIAAEDNDHAIDPTPARRSFSTRTIPPTSTIVRGPASFNPLVGQNFTFVIQGTDPDGGPNGGPGRIDTFEYLLLQTGAYGDPVQTGQQALPVFQRDTYVKLINQATGDRLPPPYDDWKWTPVYSDTLPFRNVGGPAEYVFASRAVDPEGARERNLRFITNIRHFTVVSPAALPPGPSLVVKCSALLGPLPPASEPVDKQRAPIEILEGETLSFSWLANTDSYGGLIQGYTYALDDTSAFPPLDLERTGVTFTAARLTEGYHWLYIRVTDDLGYVTNAVIPILVIQPAFRQPGAERGILYVDDSQSPGGVQNRIRNYPSDAEETDWWLNRLLPELRVPFTEWDTYLAGLDDVLGRKAPTLRDLANYSTVIWNVDFNNGLASPTALWKTVVGGASPDLTHYVKAGGTLILTGFSLGSNTTDPRTTMYTNGGKGICATLPVGTKDYNLSYFPRSLMGVDGMVSNNDGLRSLGARDFVAAYATAAGRALGFDSASVDTGPAGSTAKWITYTAGDPNTNLAPGLGQVDGWKMADEFGCADLASKGFRVEDLSQPVADPIYRYHGVPVGIGMDGGPSPREGMVVGVRVQAHDLGGQGSGTITGGGALGVIGRTIHLGFPLYFLRDEDAKRLLQAAYNYVNASPTLP